MSSSRRPAGSAQHLCRQPVRGRRSAAPVSPLDWLAEELSHLAFASLHLSSVFPRREGLLIRLNCVPVIHTVRP